jgi:cytochrome c oxidase assembly factor CtaG
MLTEIANTIPLSVLTGTLVLAGVYALLVGPLRRRYAWGPAVPAWRQAAVYAGFAIVLTALSGPLDELSDHALFSAHMAQHILLTYFAPPLWLLGIPTWLVERILRLSWQRRLAFGLVHPISAFLVFYGLMWTWHAPALYQAALENETLHIFQHLVFMASAVIGWWPLLGPAIPSSQHDTTPLFSPWARIAYLLFSMFSCTALSALIEFSPRVLYPFYEQTTPLYGLTPLADQQLGAMLMWFPADFILLACLFYWIATWMDPKLFQRSHRTA